MPDKILVVDDEESILFAVREYFTHRGYQVDCARTVDEAKALLGRGPYSVIVADLRLTGSDRVEGLEIVSCVRSRYPSTRLIVLTAYGAPDIEREARRRGVDSFLHKPTPLAELARILANLLSSSGSVHDKRRARSAEGGPNSAGPGAEDRGSVT